MVVGHWGGGGGEVKAFFKQWYGLYSPYPCVEFTFNYQMSPHNPFRRALAHKRYIVLISNG